MNATVMDFKPGGWNAKDSMTEKNVKPFWTFSKKREGIKPNKAQNLSATSTTDVT